MPKGKLVPSGVTTAARDIGGLATTGILSQSAGIVGALVSVYVSPKIAKSNGGKDFNRFFAYLMIADKALEMVLGQPGVV